MTQVSMQHQNRNVRKLALALALRGVSGLTDTSS